MYRTQNPMECSFGGELEVWFRCVLLFCPTCFCFVRFWFVVTFCSFRILKKQKAQFQYQNNKNGWNNVNKMGYSLRCTADGAEPQHTTISIQVGFRGCVKPKLPYKIRMLGDSGTSESCDKSAEASPSLRNYSDMQNLEASFYLDIFTSCSISTNCYFCHIHFN